MEIVRFQFSDWPGPAQAASEGMDAVKVAARHTEANMRCMVFVSDGRESTLKLHGYDDVTDALSEFILRVRQIEVEQRRRRTVE